jgi:catechol 2,3-dioxygenase-like lactoylglutathione lyase family enzyme
MIHRVLLPVVASGLLTVTAHAQQPAPATEGPPAVKALSMMASTMAVADLDRSEAFYIKGLGLTPTRRMESGDVIEDPLNFPGGGAYIILMKSKQGAAPVARAMSQRIILAVPDLKALEAQLKAAGFSFAGQIHEMAQFHVAVAQLEDPDGNHIELVQRTP